MFASRQNFGRFTAAIVFFPVVYGADASYDHVGICLVGGRRHPVQPRRGRHRRRARAVHTRCPHAKSRCTFFVPFVGACRCSLAHAETSFKGESGVRVGLKVR